MTKTGYSPFIIKPNGNFKCSRFEFNKRYILIRLARGSWDDCHYVTEYNQKTVVAMMWRMQTRGEFIKMYWPAIGNPEYIKNGFHVHIIFLKYRTIFKCIIRLMMLKKRVQIRIKTKKNLNIANLFRGVGNSILNTKIMAFV